MIYLVLIRVTLKIAAIILLSLFIIVTINSLLAPIYRFAQPMPFSGTKLYNPYSDFDTTVVLKRGNFHAHTRMTRGITAGRLPLYEVVNAYHSYGYDVVGISNYQTISANDPREEYQIPLYEHGYNLQKYHQLLFGKNTESLRDCSLPITASACQSVINYFAEHSDAICINHPRFTIFFPVSRMKYLRGYRFIEADAGMSKAAEWWDTGLSSGIPSFILCGDDSHNVSNLHDIASHCVFICSVSSKYADVMTALKRGNFYGMRMPNFGNGDLDIKHIENNKLPRVKNIGVLNDSIFVKLTKVADSIKFIGQGGVVRACVLGRDVASYIFQPEDTYIREEIVFDNGVRIYSNPTFRTDLPDPFTQGEVPINLPLTILMNIFRVSLSIFFIYLISLLVRSLFRWR